MISRVVATCVLVATVGAHRPAAADTPLNGAGGSTPQPAVAHPRAGKALLIIGGVLALTSAYLLVDAKRHQNDLNPDESIFDSGWGQITGFTSMLTLGLGIGLSIPIDWGAAPSSHPRIGLGPRGATVRFTF